APGQGPGRRMTEVAAARLPRETPGRRFEGWRRPGPHIPPTRGEHLMRKVIAAAAAGLIVGVAFAAGTAFADHNTPSVTVSEPGECGTTTITTSWPSDTHQVANAALVVQAG